MKRASHKSKSVAAALLLSGALSAGCIAAAFASDSSQVVDMTSSADQAAIATIAAPTETYLLTLEDQLAEKKANPDPETLAAGIVIDSAKAADATEHSLVSIHKAAGAELPEGFVVTTENCLACHGGTYDSLIEATEDYHVIYNPHESHYGEVDCYRCHSVYEEPSVWCNTCHVGFPLADGWVNYPEIGY